jgi:hypothetical protein
MYTESSSQTSSKTLSEVNSGFQPNSFMLLLANSPTTDARHRPTDARQRATTCDKPATSRSKSATTRDSLQERRFPLCHLGFGFPVICAFVICHLPRYSPPFQHFSPNPSAISTISKRTLKNPRRFNKTRCDFRFYRRLFGFTRDWNHHAQVSATRSEH